MYPEIEIDNYKLQLDLLAEKLKRSEENRQQLEQKLEQILQKRSEHDKVVRMKTRQKYQEFLDEQKKRNERNKMLVQMLEHIDEQAAAMSARSERLKMMKLEYEMYFAKLVQTQTMRCIQTATTTQIPILLPATENNTTTSIQPTHPTQSAPPLPPPTATLTSTLTPTPTPTPTPTLLPGTSSLSFLTASTPQLTARSEQSVVEYAKLMPVTDGTTFQLLLNSPRDQNISTATSTFSTDTDPNTNTLTTPRHWTLAMATPTPTGMILTKATPTSLTDYVTAIPPNAYDYLQHPIGYAASNTSNNTTNAASCMQLRTPTVAFCQRTNTDEPLAPTATTLTADLKNSTLDQISDTNASTSSLITAPVKSLFASTTHNLDFNSRINDNNFIPTLSEYKTIKTSPQLSDSKEINNVNDTDDTQVILSTTSLSFDKLPKVSMFSTEYNFAQADAIHDDNRNNKITSQTLTGATTTTTTTTTTGTTSIVDQKPQFSTKPLSSEFKDNNNKIEPLPTNLFNNIDKEKFLSSSLTAATAATGGLAINNTVNCATIAAAPAATFDTVVTHSGPNVDAIITKKEAAADDINQRQKIDENCQMPLSEQQTIKNTLVTDIENLKSNNYFNSNNNNNNNNNTSNNNYLKQSENPANDANKVSNVSQNESEITKNSIFEQVATQNQNQQKTFPNYITKKNDNKTVTPQMSIEKIENVIYGEKLNQSVENYGENVEITPMTFETNQGEVIEPIDINATATANTSNAVIEDDYTNYAAYADVDDPNSSAVISYSQQDVSDSYEPTYATIDENSVNADVYAQEAANDYGGVAGQDYNQYIDPNIDPNTMGQTDFTNLNYANYDATQYPTSYDPNVYPGYIYDETTGQYTANDENVEQEQQQQQEQQEYSVDGVDAGNYNEQTTYEQQQNFDTNQTADTYSYNNYMPDDNAVSNYNINNNNDTNSNAVNTMNAPAYEENIGTTTEILNEISTDAITITKPTKSEPTISETIANDETTTVKMLKPTSILSSADKHAATANDAQKKKKRVNFVDSSETDDNPSAKTAAIAAATATAKISATSAAATAGVGAVVRGVGGDAATSASFAIDDNKFDANTVVGDGGIGSAAGAGGSGGGGHSTTTGGTSSDSDFDFSIASDEVSNSIK